MNNCPNCHQERLVLAGSDSDVLPPPKGTGWAPLPRDYAIYRCENCGSVFRERVQPKPLEVDLPTLTRFLCVVYIVGGIGAILLGFLIFGRNLLAFLATEIFGILIVVFSVLTLRGRIAPDNRLVNLIIYILIVGAFFGAIFLSASK